MKKQTWIIMLAIVISLFCATSLCGAKERVVAAQLQSAHYLVFELDGVKINLLHHKLVQVTGLVSKTDDEIGALAEKSAGESNFVAHVLGAADEILHRDLVAVKKEVRAEFHSADGNGKIDGYSWDAERPVFVVRIPTIDGAERLRLQNHRPKLSGQSPQILAATAEPKIVYELNLQDLVRGQAAQISLAPASAPDTLVLGGDGNSGNRVDLLIMGDGYQQSERSKFFSDVQNLYEKFFNISPYGEYKNFVKVTALFVASNQSGADHPPYDASCQQYLKCCSDAEALYDPKAAGNGTFVDTAFDSSFCGSPQIHRALISDTTKVLAVAAAVPDWDSIMVIVNDDTYGGTGGYTSTFSTNEMVGVAQHEYGHSFTGLADEYDYGCSSGCYICQEPSCQANITSEIQSEKIKWNSWILSSTPIPTPSLDEYYQSLGPVGPYPNYPYFDVVGLFEGAQYTTTGVYRPYYDCTMRSLGAAFCPICTQEYILRLYRGGWGVPKDGIDLIEPGSENPAPGDISIASQTTFSIGLLQPVGGALEIEWLVNDQVVQGANSNSFVFVPSQTLNTVKLVVKDPTSLVNPSMVGDTLTFTRMWNVKAIITVCISTVSPDRWKGEYFNNMILSGSPVMVRDDGSGSTDFDWGSGSPSSTCAIGTDHFSVRWTRTVNFDADTYRFTVTGDDGFKLYVDGQLALNKWFDQPPTTYTVDVPLTAGTHTLKLEYYENGGGAVAKLSWQKVIY